VKHSSGRTSVFYTVLIVYVTFSPNSKRLTFFILDRNHYLHNIAPNTIVTITYIILEYLETTIIGRPSCKRDFIRQHCKRTVCGG